MSTALTTQHRTSALAAMASRFSIEPNALLNTLKSTVFKGASNEQLAALVVVANEHGLNPFTREIYAFPDKSGGIQAVIGVDGWIRIVNNSPAFDGVEFNYTGSGDSLACECVLHVKERAHPVRVTEYLAECRRNTDPWRSHPRRMLRHKALIQCARIAFGLASLKDEDDIRIQEHPASVTVSAPAMFAPAPEQLPAPVEDDVPWGNEEAPAAPVAVAPPPPVQTTRPASKRSPAPVLAPPAASQTVSSGDNPPDFRAGLVDFVSGQGVTFDQLVAWLKLTKRLPENAEPGSAEELPAKLCETLANEPKSLVALVAWAKGGDK